MCAAGCDAQHEIYGKVRTASEFVERLGKERELRIEAVAKLRAEGATDADVIALSEDATPRSARPTASSTWCVR